MSTTGPHYFNYRVVRTTWPADNLAEMEVVFAIHEIYYDENDKINAWSTNPVHPEGGDLNELRSDLQLMMAALDGAVLNKEDLPGV